MVKFTYMYDIMELKFSSPTGNLKLVYGVFLKTILSQNCMDCLLVTVLYGILFCYCAVSI